MNHDADAQNRRRHDDRGGHATLTPRSFPAPSTRSASSPSCAQAGRLGWGLKPSFEARSGQRWWTAPLHQDTRRLIASWPSSYAAEPNTAPNAPRVRPPSQAASPAARVAGTDSTTSLLPAGLNASTSSVRLARTVTMLGSQQLGPSSGEL